MKNLKSHLMWFLTLFLLLCVGCTEQTEREEHQRKVAELSRAGGVQPKEQKGNTDVYPLTGEPATVVQLQPAIALMVNNHPDARPQTGLQEADIVYEVLAEGSITRFLAIFQSHYPEVVGPIRSARDYFITLSQGYNALYVSYGHSPDAMSILASGAVPHLNGMGYVYSHAYDGSLFWRESYAYAPHNVYTGVEKLKQGLAHYQYNLQAPEPLLFGKSQHQQQASKVEINYSTRYNNKVTYQFDKISQKYTRYVNDDVAVDRDTEQPLQMSNVFVVAVPHQVIDSQGRRSLNLLQGGEGWLFSDGGVVKVLWENRNNRLLPFKDGQPVPFAPGNTWINIIPAHESDQMLSF
ncbi:DUF3048 domain-containing protein [Aureibacillus halotolerans]|uniref:DUF3048 family protein n=1 Tax=Aureibacillus halotolerans TaxID=1508390 RepID=A0A4R6TQW8_9BACI|nr:DUF3048 domain-containing protein [Aureibacillus halotolerans]TDQ34157.1 DUF3048 family protein [Aureibacillus halotolerans]